MLPLCTLIKEIRMADKKNKTAKAVAEKTSTDTIPSEESTGDMTNVRHRKQLDDLIAELNKLAEEDDDAGRGFRIGDVVETATKAFKVRVRDLQKKVRLSRTRMCDCRTTAIAFAGESRKVNVPFHFFTLAARAATKFGMTPEEALQKVTEKGFDSTRQVSRFFADMRRAQDNGEALEKSALLVAKHGDLLDRCHHDDFRNVIARLEPASVKLVIADPSYDGKRKSSTSATTRVIDGNTEQQARTDIDDLLKMLADKMAKSGAVVLFRPGAALDPAWLANAIESNGWVCAWALTWNKHKAKPGRTDAPYGIASERVLILSRRDAKLTAHNDSPRDDVLDFKPVQPHYADSEPNHQHEKPLDLMRHLIGKHTFEGEVAIEPFGGTGPASQAAAEMNRRFLYCETAKENFDVGTARVAAAIQARQKTAG
jgi:DNA modification methylase